MKHIHFIIILIFILSVANFSSAAEEQKYAKTIKIYKASSQVAPYFKKSYGYAVFPTIGKGGFIVGAAQGTGKVYRRGKVTGICTLSQISVGAQVGGKKFSEIVFFQDKRAYEEFTTGSFEFSANAAAVAITAGAQAQAGTSGKTAGASTGPATFVQAETKYSKGMAIFINAKGGLMLEATIGGQKFEFEPLK